MTNNSIKTELFASYGTSLSLTQKTRLSLSQSLDMSEPKWACNWIKFINEIWGLFPSLSLLKYTVFQTSLGMGYDKTVKSNLLNAYTLFF